MAAWATPYANISSALVALRSGAIRCAVAATPPNRKRVAVDAPRAPPARTRTHSAIIGESFSLAFAALAPPCELAVVGDSMAESFIGFAYAATADPVLKAAVNEGIAAVQASGDMVRRGRRGRRDEAADTPCAVSPIPAAIAPPRRTRTSSTSPSRARARPRPRRSCRRS